MVELAEDGREEIVTAFDPVKGHGPELARFEVDPILKENNAPLCNISPDGTRLAASRGPEGPIQILSLRGQPTEVIPTKGLTGIQSLNWAADGKALFISSGTKEGSVLFRVDLQGNTIMVWKCVTGRCFGVPSPDGRHLAIYSEKRSANMWMMENF